MSQVPGPLTASRVSLADDGSVAEVVMDNGGRAYARYMSMHSWGTWSAWWLVGASVVDVSIAGQGGGLPGIGQVAPGADGAQALISVVFQGGASGYYVVTSNGVSGCSF
jgi:hypothetical protein